MGSSKEAGNLVFIPDGVIALSKVKPSVVICNFPPWQRKGRKSNCDRQHPNYGDGVMIWDEFDYFLSYLASPMMAAILYKDYGKGIFTVVVELKPVICWCADGLPRLEFEEPENWNHCPNMWGGFVLAVVQVADMDPKPVIEDPNGEHFIKLAERNGVPTIWML